MSVLFQTDRLLARRLIPSDAPAMQAVYGDPEGMRFVGDGNPLTVENCVYWIEVTDRNFERRGYGMIALIEKESGDLVGCAGVVHPNQQEDPEVKYAFRPQSWGKGFATEAVQGLVAHAESALNKTELMATVNPLHTASQSVLRKSGFHHDRDRKNEDGSLTQIWLWTSNLKI